MEYRSTDTQISLNEESVIQSYTPDPNATRIIDKDEGTNRQTIRRDVDNPWIITEGNFARLSATLENWKTGQKLQAQIKEVTPLDFSQLALNQLSTHVLKLTGILSECTGNIIAYDERLASFQRFARDFQRKPGILNQEGTVKTLNGRQEVVFSDTDVRLFPFVEIWTFDERNEIYKHSQTTVNTGTNLDYTYTDQFEPPTKIRLKISIVEWLQKQVAQKLREAYKRALKIREQVVQRTHPELVEIDQEMEAITTKLAQIDTTLQPGRGYVNVDRDLIPLTRRKIALMDKRVKTEATLTQTLQQVIEPMEKALGKLHTNN